MPDKETGRGSLTRGLRLLELVAADLQGTMTIGALASATGLDKGTTSRLVKTLEELGYLSRTPSRSIILTNRVRALGQDHQEGESLVNAARPLMLKMSRDHRETFHLATANRSRVAYVESVRPLVETAFGSIVGMTADMHVTATGRSILYALPVKESNILIEECIASPIEGSLIFERDEFEQGRRDAASCGYVRLYRGDNVVRVAAVVTDKRGKPIASVGAFSSGGDDDRRADALGHACMAVVASVDTP